MKASNTDTGNGSNVSGGVWLPKGTTLEGMMLICSSVVNKQNQNTSLITFSAHLVGDENVHDTKKIKAVFQNPYFKQQKAHIKIP